MPVALDFLGYRYDDAVPAFVICSDWYVYHRPAHQMLNYPALMADIAAAAYTPGSNEIGEDDSWLMANLGMANVASAVTPPPATAPITATAALGAKTITIGGGPSDGAYTITVTYQIDGSGTDVTVTQSVAQGDTADDTATALAAKFSGDLTATTAGGVVTLALGTATSLDTLAAVAA